MTKFVRLYEEENILLAHNNYSQHRYQLMNTLKLDNYK